MTIEVSQFPARLSELRNLLHAGESVQLTLDGEPLGTLTPPAPPPPPTELPRFGCAKGSFTWIAPDFNEPLPDWFWDGEDGP